MTSRNIMLGFLLVFLWVCAAGYVRFANSQGSSGEGNQMIMNEDTKVPATKIPPISTNANTVLHALLERVWVTKYFGAPAEIYDFSSDMPLCETLPDFHLKRNIENEVFLWQDEKCLPLEMWSEVNKEDLSGTVIVRMLDFGKAREVLEEAFKIIRTNSLGAYKIEADKIDSIKKIIRKKLDSYDSDYPINYESKLLKTYPILEGRYFLEETSIGSPGVTNESEDIRKYFSHRGRKYALTLKYNTAGVTKKGNVIEYSLTAPAGFFGMEKDFEKGKTP